MSKPNTPEPANPELAAALAPFLCPGGGRQGSGSEAVLTAEGLARAFADAAARLAALPADALGEYPIATSFMAQPHGGHDAPQEHLTAWVDALTEAIAPAARAERLLMGTGSVHYTAHAVSPAGLTLTWLAQVEPNEQERTEHAWQQAGHRIILWPAGGTEAKPLYRVRCGCGDYEGGPSVIGHARRGWRVHAAAAMARIGKPERPGAAANRALTRERARERARGTREAER